MHGRAAGCAPSARRAACTSTAICRTPATSASCDTGIGIRARRLFIEGAVEGVIVGSRSESDRMAAITPARGAAGSAGARIVSDQATHSGSLTQCVSAGATRSTRSLITRSRTVRGRRSSSSCGSTVIVISAPCPLRVLPPGVIETGIRTRLSA